MKNKSAILLAGLAVAGMAMASGSERAVAVGKKDGTVVAAKPNGTVGSKPEQGLRKSGAQSLVAPEGSKDPYSTPLLRDARPLGGAR